MVTYYQVRNQVDHFSLYIAISVSYSVIYMHITYSLDIQMNCDLDEMSHKYCIGFDLRVELEKGSLPSKAAIPKPRKKIR